MDANSILFVDKNFLSEPVLLDRRVHGDLTSGEITASNMGISDEDFAVISTIMANNNSDYMVTMFDIDGALFLPLTPVDLSSFDPANQTLQIELSWDIAEAIQYDGDEYFMENQV